MAQPELNNDAITEILLRFPPADPACLIRAALVCKPLRRILTGSAFLRRYREFHRTPPLLGFISRGWHSELGNFTPCFVPTATAPPFPETPQDCSHSSVIDCRHGRVLLNAFNQDDFVVWDPITGNQEKVNKPSIPIPYRDYSAAVLCAMAGCDHRNCHGAPFSVLILGLEDTQGPVHACLYSSETQSWGTPAVPLHADIDSRLDVLCGALVKDEFYYCVWGNRIIEYDLGKNCLSTIDLPNDLGKNFLSLIDPRKLNPDSCGLCMLMEDGSLGFACIKDSGLYLWSRKVKPDGDVGWVQCKVVELSKLEELVPALSKKKKKWVTELVGAAQGADVVFMATSVGIVMYDFKSGEARKVREKPLCLDLSPFMFFYTPGTVMI
ncbi:hypothetical protein PR202_gb12116 [Eleusine coracana subsp. coracana]|uniref:F-box domain-containing protein n=1 Tax=Eleusine coracana subsp. coracana TaxID=191504 RepID=A0AAV5ENQ2_ELECO|nr:hypothetical protein PR202_gb12116 [Eleusine coracana subsp. coracana]